MLPHTIGKWTMIAGLASMVLTFWGTANHVFPFYPHTYFFAWYGLILFLDGLLWWRWRKGMVFQRPFQFFTLLFWSAVFWFFFEIWNLRLQNWYYAGVPPKGPWAHVEAYLDFATVLPGMFLVYRLLCCLKFPRQVTTSFRVSTRLHKHWVALGLIMLVLPLVYPALFFPCVWVGLIFLLEPACARSKGPSVLREAENGQWTTLVRLLLAGLLCGGYWELCNFWSLEKWIYTVPFFSQGKLFEMPYLGFLGFPPFCVQCFVMANAVFLVRGGRYWDPDTSEPTQPVPPPRGTYLVLIVLGLLLSEFSYSQMAKKTIDSRSEPLEHILADISPADGRKLAKRGWCYPVQVLTNWEEAGQSIAVPFQEPIRQRLELTAHLHMGSANARLLEKGGVFSLDALGRSDADQLYDTLVSVNQKEQLRETPLLRRRVMAWTEGAKRKSAFY
jgi:hypothetical protein